MLKKLIASEFGRELSKGKGAYEGFYAWIHDETGILISLKIERVDSEVDNWIWFVTQVSKINDVEDNWNESRRISPVLFLIESHKVNDLETDLEKRAIQVFELSLPLETNVASEFLATISLNIRKWHWAKHKQDNTSKFKKYFDLIGINRSTTLDYLNLQSLALKDYQRIIATVENQNTLTIRDRIAYARRHGWIDKVGHGVRTPEMTKLRNKKEGK